MNREDYSTLMDLKSILIIIDIKSSMMLLLLLLLSVAVVAPTIVLAASNAARHRDDASRSRPKKDLTLSLVVLGEQSILTPTLTLFSKHPIKLGLEFDFDIVGRHSSKARGTIQEQNSLLYYKHFIRRINKRLLLITK